MGQEKISWLGISFFIGWAVFSLVSPPLADKYGRKSVLLINASVFLALSLAILLSKSLNVTIGLLFCLGCTIPGFMSVGYLYACEMLSPSQRNVFNLVYCFYETMINIIAILTYWFLDNNYFWITAV